MDVVTLGESMILLTPDTDGPLRFVNSFHKTIGGAESNVAIALSRLGHQVGWISKLGDDEFGLYIRNFIRGEGVDTSQVTFAKLASTAVYFKESQPGQDPKVYYYRKHSAASEMKPLDIDQAYFKQAKFVHLTGITPALSASCKETIYHAIKLARQSEAKIVFDPNVRLKLWSKQEAKETLLDIALQSDIVLPGIEEGELITGETEPEKIAAALLKGKVQAVVVKLGAKGAYFATKDESAYVPGYEVKSIIDTVGAGDGFAAGFLSGLIREWDYKKAVQFGNRIGAYALGVKGDVEGYPFWQQVNPEKTGEDILR
ncbi:sugar kinase [Aquibacillus salsiterrae]|uniref:Sugar kinase n=1 Tax=Aquibacillus salsiterrae TaxID=2950439 RepID=A0A9X3WH39_9BACI|nr:sugar kinase [Aquibacillus salsiterrae]MDC3416911.1 sugar kinase [Aquibacillus salsiterrae]